jgi:hypothetical protein
MMKKKVLGVILMIYFILHSDKQRPYLKIGYTTTSPELRLNQLNAMNPNPLVLLGSIPGNQKREKEIHKMFHHYRISGEWFLYSDEIRDYLMGIGINGKLVSNSINSDKAHHLASVQNLYDDTRRKNEHLTKSIEKLTRQNEELRLLLNDNDLNISHLANITMLDESRLLEALLEIKDDRISYLLSVLAEQGISLSDVNQKNTKDNIKFGTSLG